MLKKPALIIIAIALSCWQELANDLTASLWLVRAQEIEN